MDAVTLLRALRFFPSKKTKQKCAERQTEMEKSNQELISHWNKRKTSPKRTG